MKYYTVNDIKYAETIPREWSTNHLVGTGPHECVLCVKYGFTNENIWVGYCWRCAGQDSTTPSASATANHYGGSRGLGYIAKGVLYRKVDDFTDEDWAAINLAYEMRNDEPISEIQYEYGSELNGGYNSY